MAMRGSDPRYGGDAAIAERSRWWWAPLVLIAVALVLLFVAPFVTSERLTGVRRHAAEFTSPALVRVNDLQASLALETAARSEQARGGGEAIAAGSAAVAARATTAMDEHLLDSLVSRISPEAVARAEEARAAIIAWQAEEDRLARQISAADGRVDSATMATRNRRWEAVEAALASTQRLEDVLNAGTVSERATIARLERLNVMVPAALVPLALLALLAVAWTARRTILLSHEARRGRLAAEAAMASKSALMRGVTHDLKNPIGAARGYADLLAEGALGPVPESQIQVVGRLRNLLTVTLDTVNDLVELSRVDSGELRIDQHETNVVAIAREVCDDYRAMAAAAGLHLTLDDSAAGDGAGVVRTDPVRVRQVMGNLLSNAVKYTPSGGNVVIRASQVVVDPLGQAVALEVIDDGPGIAPSFREKVFGEFFRVPNDNGADGAGVGLAIARRVARLLGGDLRLRDTPGGGATFTLLLPLRRAK
jgi:signal transduction histidine kinase